MISSWNFHHSIIMDNKFFHFTIKSERGTIEKSNTLQNNCNAVIDAKYYTPEPLMSKVPVGFYCTGFNFFI